MQLFLEADDPVLLPLNIVPEAFRRKTPQNIVRHDHTFNRVFQCVLEHCIVGYNKLIRTVLSTFNSKMAARASLFYRSLHNLEACHRLQSIQKSYAEAHGYPKEVWSYGGGK